MRSLLSPQRTSNPDQGAIFFPLLFGDRSTWLRLASRGGHAEFALGLVDHGVNVNARDFDELTPLHIALKGGQVEISWLLVEHASDVSATSVPFQRRSTFKLQEGFNTTTSH